MEIRSLARKLRSVVEKRPKDLASASGDEKLQLAHQQIRKKNQRLKKLQQRLEENQRELTRLRMQAEGDNGGAEVGGVKPENVIWIFGTGRSGTTWLASMLQSLPDFERWEEPLVGSLFGEFYYGRAAHRRGGGQIMGEPHRKLWLRSVRAMVLEGAVARFGSHEGFLIVKEPHGSVGAPLLSAALPESRLITLVRDPRDVTASALNAQRLGGWAAERMGRKTESGVDANPLSFVRNRARLYLRDVGNAVDAYHSHPGPKTLLRYEDLRARTLAEMRRALDELGISVLDEELRHAVAEHSWENIPEEEKGEGKFFRKASPGSWREDLTPEQAEIVEDITAPLLNQFYPESNIQQESVEKTAESRTNKVRPSRFFSNDRGGVEAEDIVWIFGSARSGSSWLAAMMGEIRGHRVWFEPRIGNLLDPDVLERLGGNHKGAQYVFSAQYKKVWLSSVRQLVLDGANARFPGGLETLVIKEPGMSSAGAPLLMEALPESRMVLLVRDPRDVVASMLDATGEGGWMAKRGKERTPDVELFVRELAEGYFKNIVASSEAYESHAGRKVLVRYEDLRTEPLGTMERLYSELGMIVDKEELARVIQKHSWENIPEEEKGEGKFFRKASLGSWREDLTLEQAETVERITAPLLKQFYAEER